MPVHDFASPRPKVMTFHSAKGLTFDTVIMPGLVHDCFSRTSHERVTRLLFVAVTRATKWCYFSTRSRPALDVLEEKLLPLGATGAMTVRGYDDRQNDGHGANPARGGGDAGDLDFL